MCIILTMLTIPSMAVTLYSFPSNSTSYAPTNIISLSSPTSATANSSSAVASKTDVGLIDTTCPIYLAVEKPSSASGGTVNNVGTLTFTDYVKLTDSGTYKNITVTINVTSVKFLAASGTIEHPNYKVPILAGAGPSGLIVGNGKGGNKWPGKVQVSMSISISGATSMDLEQVVYGAEDLDQGGVNEGITFNSSFDEVCWWPGHLIDNSGDKYYAPSDMPDCDTDYEKWIYAGVVGHPSSSSFSVMHQVGKGCGTSVTIYSSYTERDSYTGGGYTPPVVEDPEYGNIKIQKSLTGSPGGTLQGFNFTVKDKNGTPITKETNSSGVANFTNLDIEYSPYTITEQLTSAQIAAGYSKVSITPASVDLTYDGQTVTVNAVNDFSPLSLKVTKKTNDGGSAENFSFKVTGPSFPNGKILKTTNRIDDTTYSTNLIKKDDSGVNIAEGTYTVEEVLDEEQARRYKQPEAQSITLDIGTKEQAYFEFENKARTWDVKLKKEATDGNVSGLNFKVTGETDYGKSITKNVQSDANGNILVEGMQAGEYVIEEIDFDAEKYINVKEVDGFDKPAIKFTVTGDEPEGQVVDLANASGDAYVFENIRKSSLKTSFVGESGEHIANPTDKTPLKDFVSYTNLKPGAEYTLKFTMNDKANGTKHGEVITKTFSAEASAGTVSVDLEINALDLQNKTFVAFEELYYKGIKIAEHTNINDLDQTLYFPLVKTEAFTESLYDIKNARFGDKIFYSNMLPGKEYKVKTKVYDKDDKKFLPIESTDTLRLSSLSADSPVATVISSDATENSSDATGNSSSEPLLLGSASDNGTYGFDGEMTVNLMGNLKEAEGHDIVLFVEFYLNEKLVASHTDVNDEKETIHVPEGEKFTPLSVLSKSLPTTGDQSVLILFIWIIAIAGASLYLVRKYLR